MTAKRSFVPSAAAREASDYFNSLPREQRAKLVPLLDNYRQMGLAEAEEHFGLAMRKVGQRINAMRSGRS